MADINTTLTERGKTHGDFKENAKLAQSLKDLIRDSVRGRDFPPTMRESLDLICTKLSRILTGDCEEPDHWKDIAGYATLVERSLTP